MNCQFVHQNFNVRDLAASIAFYETNLGLKIEKRRMAADESFELVFMGDGSTGFLLELTWLRDWKEPYNLGDNEIHLAVRVPDMEAARAFHREQGVICYENTAMGLYFIADPDGYWIEIVK
jgi:lactoylglutathione lyase